MWPYTRIGDFFSPEMRFWIAAATRSDCSHNSQIITDDIKKGVYSPTAKLPTENELCTKYNVSRITVRKAILDLVEEGYLIRQQGKGTFVKSPKLKRELIAVNGYSEFMESTGKKPKHHVLSHDIIPASKPIAEKLKSIPRALSLN